MISKAMLTFSIALCLIAAIWYAWGFCLAAPYGVALSGPFPGSELTSRSCDEVRYTAHGWFILVSPRLDQAPETCNEDGPKTKTCSRKSNNATYLVYDYQPFEMAACLR